MTYTLLLLILLLQSSLWEEEISSKSPFQIMLEKNQSLKTKEYVVTIKDVTYHKIEVEGESFYFSALSKANKVPLYLCQAPGGHTSEHLVETSLKIGKRKRFFFQALKEKCTTLDDFGRQTNNKRTSIQVNPVVGIHLPESKGDLIKNKQIGIPLLRQNSLIFAGEF